MEKSLIQFLKSFFNLFRAEIDKITIYSNEVIGTVGWPEEDDKQDFYWKIENWNIDFSKLSLLCNFISNKNLINGDHITISYEALLSRLIDARWDSKDAKQSLDYLCSFEIKMIDDGEKTDSFYIHF